MTCGIRSLSIPTGLVGVLAPRLLVGGLLAGCFLSGCVPYVRFQETQKQLDLANELNQDLERALANERVSASATGGDSRIVQAKFDALRTKYDGLQSERDSLLETNGRLMRQLENLPGIPVPSGFDRTDVEESGLGLTSTGALVIGDVLFASGKHTLKQGQISELDELARLLKDKYADRLIHIEGHTDNVPISRSKNADNWELSVKRAHSVFSYLIGQGGLEESRFRLHGFGYSRPAEGVKSPDSKEGRARCRRVEIRLGA